MTPWLDDIRIEDLDEPYHTIAIKLGLETAKQIAELYQGNQVYFPRLEKVCDPKRKELIRKEFNGYNFRTLAARYGYTERWIRIVVDDMVGKERSRPGEGQMSFL